MICKTCREKPAYRGIKNITCKRCSKESFINIAYASRLCNDCSDSNGTCQCCGDNIQSNKICNYCKDDSLYNKALLIHKQVDDHMFGWSSEIKLENIVYDKIYTYVEVRNGQGYLRMTDEDNNCIDSGERIEINYCPMCGEKLNNNK